VQLGNEGGFRGAEIFDFDGITEFSELTELLRGKAKGFYFDRRNMKDMIRMA